MDMKLNVKFQLKIISIIYLRYANFYLIVRTRTKSSIISHEIGPINAKRMPKLKHITFLFNI